MLRAAAVSGCVVALLFSNTSAGQANPNNDANAAAARDRQIDEQLRSEQNRRSPQPGFTSAGGSTGHDPRLDRVDCWNGQTWIYRIDCPPNPAETAAREQAQRELDERNRIINEQQAEQSRRDSEAAPARQLEEMRRLQAEIGRQRDQDRRDFEAAAARQQDQARRDAQANAIADRLAELWRQWDTRSGLPSSQERFLEDGWQLYINEFKAELFAQRQVTYLGALLHLEMAEEWRIRGNTAVAAAHIDDAIRGFLSVARTLGVDDSEDQNLIAGAQQMVDRLTRARSPYRPLLSSDYESIAKIYTPDIKPVNASPGRFAYDLDARSAAIRKMVKELPPPPEESTKCPLPISRPKDLSQAYYQRGRDISGDLPAKRNCYEESLRINPNNADALWDLANFAAAVDRRESVELFRRFIALVPPARACWAYLIIARSEVALGDYAEAKSAVEQAAALSADSGLRTQLDKVLAEIEVAGK